MLDLYNLACLDAHNDIRTCLPRVAQFLDKQRVHPTAPYKAIELFHTLNTVRPKRILEIGCGMTTCVFGMYAKEYGAEVIATEDNAEYREDVISRLGELAGNVSIRQVPLIQNGETVCHFAPDCKIMHDVDLLYIDGPANKGNEVRVDVEHILDSGVEPRLIMFDFSAATVKRFTEKYADRYWWQLGSQVSKGGKWYLNGLRHHTFAWRR